MSSMSDAAAAASSALEDVRGGGASLELAQLNDGASSFTRTDDQMRGKDKDSSERTFLGFPSTIRNIVLNELCEVSIPCILSFLRVAFNSNLTHFV